MSIQLAHGIPNPSVAGNPGELNSVGKAKTPAGERSITLADHPSTAVNPKNGGLAISSNFENSLTKSVVNALKRGATTIAGKINDAGKRVRDGIKDLDLLIGWKKLYPNAESAKAKINEDLESLKGLSGDGFAKKKAELLKMIENSGKQKYIGLGEIKKYINKIENKKIASTIGVPKRPPEDVLDAQRAKPLPKINYIDEGKKLYEKLSQQINELKPWYDELKRIDKQLTRKVTDRNQYNGPRFYKFADNSRALDAKIKNIEAKLRPLENIRLQVALLIEGAKKPHEMDEGELKSIKNTLKEARKILQDLKQPPTTSHVADR